jgi:hypothetical protein
VKQGRRSLGAVMARFPLAEPVRGGHPRASHTSGRQPHPARATATKATVTKLRDEQ